MNLLNNYFHLSLLDCFSCLTKPNKDRNLFSFLKYAEADEVSHQLHRLLDILASSIL